MCLLFKESVSALKLELINGRRLQDRGPFFNVRDTIGVVCAHRENEQLPQSTSGYSRLMPVLRRRLTGCEIHTLWQTCMQRRQSLELVEMSWALPYHALKTYLNNVTGHLYKQST